MTAFGKSSQKCRKAIELHQVSGAPEKFEPLALGLVVWRCGINCLFAGSSAAEYYFDMVGA